MDYAGDMRIHCITSKEFLSEIVKQITITELNILKKSTAKISAIKKVK